MQCVGRIPAPVSAAFQHPQLQWSEILILGIFRAVSCEKFRFYM